MTTDAVKSAEQLAAEAKQSEADAKPKMTTSVGGLLGGIAKKAAAKKMSPTTPGRRERRS